jgi:hypothetical protein
MLFFLTLLDFSLKEVNIVELYFCFVLDFDIIKHFFGRVVAFILSLAALIIFIDYLSISVLL